MVIAAISASAVIVTLLGFIATRAASARVRVLEQKVVGVAGGPLNSGPGIVIGVDFHTQDDRPPTDYVAKLWDDAGEALPIEALYEPGKSAFITPLGYPKPIRKPRLELWLGHQKVASANLAPFPLPVNEKLKVTPNSHYRLECAPSLLEGVSRYELTIRRSNPPPKAEIVRWKIVRTDRCLPPAGNGETELERSQTLYYGGAATAAEVTINRYRQVVQTEDVALPSLELSNEGGQTHAVIEKDTPVPNRLECPLVLAAQSPSAVANRAADRRSVNVNLNFPGQSTYTSVLPRTSYGVKLLTPSPEEVGLKVLALNGLGSYAKTTTKSPSKTLNMVVRLFRTEFKLVGSETLTLPIVKTKALTPLGAVPLQEITANGP